jgi:hypothetical protein
MWLGAVIHFVLTRSITANSHVGHWQINFLRQVKDFRQTKNQKDHQITEGPAASNQQDQKAEV